MAKNGNGAKRNCHMSFLAFHILDLKIVPNYSQINSAPENQTHFSKKMGVVPRKAAKIEEVVRNLQKTYFDSTKPKTGKWWDETPPPKKKMGHFMDPPSPRNSLKFYNLTARNAMKMKLTTIVHLYKTFHFQ